MRTSSATHSRPQSHRFQNSVLDKITRTSSKSVITAYGFISAGLFIYGSFQGYTSMGLQIALGLLGLLTFSLAEYLIHRFTYHSGDYKKEDSWQFKVHGVHHAHPTDKDRLAMPLVLALVVSGALFVLLFLVMGNLAFFFFPGFLLGYGLYLWVHYLVHTRKPPKNVFGYLWTHHHMHHYRHDDKAYGVSSPLWDYVFGTMPPRPGTRQQTTVKRS